MYSRHKSYEWVSLSATTYYKLTDQLLC
jgi:hypothetical protein